MAIKMIYFVQIDKRSFLPTRWVGNLCSEYIGFVRKRNGFCGLTTFLVCFFNKRKRTSVFLVSCEGFLA